MKSNNIFLQKYGVWIAPIILFLILALGYNSPLISGKSILQHDIIQYKGGAEELNTFREKTGKETYWTNSMFGGMPTFQLGARYPGDVIGNVDKVLNFLPKPANYIFLLLCGFYLLGVAAFRNWKYALLGALFFGFTTYIYIIIAAGHNGKVHTIAYIPPVYAGIWYIFYRKKYALGFGITTLFLTLQLYANHAQMTYYSFIVLGFLFLSEIIRTFINKTSFKHLLYACGTALAAIVFAVGMNSQRLITNAEYIKATVRGDKILPDGFSNSSSSKGNSGMDKDAILQWSYGKFESLNLLIPRLLGGSSNEKGSEKVLEDIMAWRDENISSQEEMMKAFSGLGSLSYWGDQPGTSGPAYQGIIVVFFAIFGFIFSPKKYSYWILGASTLCLFLAWGSNFQWLSDIFIDYVPFYNKFRAPSSILVVLEILFPLIAVYGIYSLFESNNKVEIKTKSFLIYSGIFIGFLVLLLVLGTSILSFSTESERNSMPTDLLAILQKYRSGMYKTDIWRAFGFLIPTIILVYFTLKKQIKKEYALAGIALLSMIDLWNVNKNYLNDTNFVAKNVAEKPFLIKQEDTENQESPEIQNLLALENVNASLMQIKKADPSYYRVFNTTANPFSENNTSYFHHSLGGYSAVKLRRMDDIIDYYFNFKDNSRGIGTAAVVNMLNTKYIVSGTLEKPQISQNPDASGAVWLVNSIKPVQNAGEELTRINDTDLKNIAIINTKEMKLKNSNFSPSKSIIKLKTYTPNHLSYTFSGNSNALAVFSEIYYPYGWKATIDGIETPILRANYLLRALEIPAGQHTIDFNFHPNTIEKGGTLSLIFSLLFLGALAVLVYVENKNRPKQLPQTD